VWWPHNRALLYENLPWIVEVYIVCILAGGVVVWFGGALFSLTQ